ncbi:MAG: M23 family metallopeptidase [Bacteroides sp.]|nr:M23 family metallopeptidase [Bacteroides sp.]MCM1086392.1 M23 family metallopeptidase [Bacteroides sp.]
MKRNRHILKNIWKHAFTNVRHKYRFSITDENFHEKFSFRLSSLNFWTIVSLCSIILIAFTVFIVVFTPVRQFIPGYVKKDLVEQTVRDRMRLDSLQLQLETQSLMLRTLNAVLTGNIPMDDTKIIRDSLRDYSNIEYHNSLADSLLRLEIERSDKYTLDLNAVQLSGGDPKNASFADNILFYVPAEGSVYQKFDHQTRHYGIDLEVEPNSVIKSVLDGSVVLTTWSPERGHIMVIEHDSKIISIYTAAATLFKRTGEFVRAGEAIGIAGQSARNGEVVHLHFELWYNGTPVDPEKHMIL